MCLPIYHAVLQNRMLKDGKLNAYWVMCNNNMQAAANMNEEGFPGYRNPKNFIVVSDPYPTVTAMAADLILQIRERAIIGLSEDGDEDDLEQLIAQLHENGRLTPTIILRALCLGDLEFFEGAIAELSGVPLKNVRTLIHDPGKLGLTAVFKQAGLPTNYFPAARAAIDVAAETEYDGGENDRQRYSRRMIERILTQYEHFGIEFESDDVDYLLTKMDSLPPGTLDRSLWAS